MHRLAIVIPFRDRAQHLSVFMPHLRAYFARDKADRALSYRVLIIEQYGTQPFNRGALLNVGFALAETDCDYVCFHDVDYLPIWADYSMVDCPTPLVWHGAEYRPIAPGRSERAVRHELEHYYSGAILVPTGQFRQVDGFSNTYWGWGFEDVDLKRRFDRAGIAFGRRRGTFQAIDHDNVGFNLDGTPSPISRVNQRLFDDRWSPGAPPTPDGLSTLDTQIMRRQSLPDLKPERHADWTQVTVRLNFEPTAEQAEAVALGAARGSGRDRRAARRGR